MAWSPLARELREFEYTSLRSKPRAFRIIKLLPSTRSWFPPFRETLNIKILEANVDDATTKYDTLSYCWGSGAADRIVVVSHFHNDTGCEEYTTICISASLESALLSLVRNRDIENSRPIFADQICINQADNIEKIQQVGLMGDIYSKSAKTIVWLGEETTETRHCFDFASEINSEGILSRMMGPNVSHYMNVFDAVMDSSLELETEAEREDRDDSLDLIARYGPRFPLRGLTEILLRAWVNRLWTVQEGCLPPELIFRCGEQSLCYDCFRATLLFYSIWNTYWLRIPKEAVPKGEVRARNQIFNLNKPFLRLIKERRRIHTTRSPRKSLVDVVIQYNVNDNMPKIGATKAEDRIYALLGLARDDEITRKIVEGMEIDNVRASFTKFAASVIPKNPDLLLFSQIPKSPEHRDQLPSWVPDWSTDPLRIPHGYADLTTPVFSAGGHVSSRDVVAEVSTGTLRVNAISIGRVIRVGLRGIQRDEEALVENIEYMSVRHFFEEINQFMELATNINPIYALDMKDEQSRLASTIRLSDGGLSIRQFPAQFDPGAANYTLQRIHLEVSNWGKKLIDVEARNRLMRSFTGMIRSTGVMPWYWTPASEVDMIRLCALDPIAAARIWIQGFSLTVSDVGSVIWHVTKLRLHTIWIRIRRTQAKHDLQSPDHDIALSKVGLTGDLVHSKEWELYTSNLFKNIGRKLFLTETGYIGLGPYHMEVNDNIIVVPGSTVPHVLRPRGTSDIQDHRTMLSWSYVGEAYCDGIMDGELAARESKVTQVFVIT
ncbi:heterokaryon incompatibility protein-domain-containing protein [Xylaria sp. FL1042]|nr:heterokaryon incompatibility protein-domain-containing protein [Xylaria sp. FL1042]